ncbi:MAG: YerC/YecD family TrpR-related protein [Bacillota bacterium]
MKDPEVVYRELECLLEAIVTIDNTTDARAFLRDLCTINELTAMAERWEVVRLLETGMTYRDICEQTGSSTATITRVAHWLNSGTGGYRQVLKKQAAKAQPAGLKS